MTQLYHQASQQGIWTALGPPQSAAFALAQPLTITYGDGTQDSLSAHVPAVTSAGTTQVDRTGAVWLLYVVHGDPTLRIVREMDQGTIAGAYAPLARVLADRVVPYQPDNGQAQSSASSQSFLPLTVTNNSSTQSIGGSVSVPVASTGTDYVVQCQLGGTAASSVWNALSDKTAFGDLQVIFAGAEIDADVDQQTNGAWSSSNITLWFRLQRPIAALGTDQGYQLRLGGGPRSSPARSLANIYPFSDDFVGSSLSSGWSVSGSPAIGVSGGLLTLGATNNAGAAYGIIAPYSYGPGYEVRTRLAIGAITAHSHTLRLLSSGSTIGNPQDVFESFSGNSTTQWYLASSSGGGSALLGTIDGGYHILTLAREAAGTLHGRFDGSAATTLAATLVGALYPALSVLSQDTSTAQLLVDWLKVRPWVSAEPTVSAGTLQSAGALRWEPITDSTGSVLIAPSGDPIMALVAAS